MLIFGSIACITTMIFSKMLKQSKLIKLYLTSFCRLHAKAASSRHDEVALAWSLQKLVKYNLINLLFSVSWNTFNVNQDEVSNLFRYDILPDTCACEIYIYVERERDREREKEREWWCTLMGYYSILVGHPSDTYVWLLIYIILHHHGYICIGMFIIIFTHYT